MSKPIINGNTVQIPVKYLLKKYKKGSGYKKAKKIYGKGNLTKHVAFEDDAYICETIHEIADDCAEHAGYEFPDTVNVHAAFRQVAPFMFKAEHANENFIFGWLKKPYAEAMDEGSSNTELRIRILKLILLVNPNAVLNIKITPLD
jgi:hypothetical protein